MNSPQPRPQIDPKNLQLCLCPSCGHDIIEQKLRMYKVSAILSGDPQDSYVGTEVLICAKCGEEVSPKTFKTLPPGQGIK